MVAVDVKVADLKPAVAYLRVSTEEQTIENQKIAIEKWARENNYLLIRLYEDEALSGKIPPLKRDGFRRLIQELPLLSPKPKACLVYELSRVGRTFYETLEAIRTLETLEVPLISISPKEIWLQNLDPSIRKLILAILTWVAERERDMISQRTKEGIQRAKLQGKKIGRPKIAISKRQVLRYLERGLTVNAIAKILQVSYKTLRRRLNEWGINPWVYRSSQYIEHKSS